MDAEKCSSVQKPEKSKSQAFHTEMTQALWLTELSELTKMTLTSGEVSERLKEPVSKTGVVPSTTVGSNPTLSVPLDAHDAKVLRSWALAFLRRSQ